MNQLNFYAPYPGPTAAEFLAINPLPANLAHLAPAIQQLPLSLLLDLIFGGDAMGASEAQIHAGIREAAEFHAEQRQRCGACLGWTDLDHSFVIIRDDGAIRFGAFCKRCWDSVANDSATQTMINNMRSYLD